MGGQEGEKRGLRIDSSTVGMESARNYKTSRFTALRFSVRDFKGALAQGRNTLNAQIGRDTKDTEDTGEAGGSSRRPSEAVEEWRSRFPAPGARPNIRSGPMETFNAIKFNTVNYILDLFFGYRRREWDPWSGMGAGQMEQVDAVQWTLSQETCLRESETTSFSTQGTVRTGDGRVIPFQVHVEMSREFRQYYQEELQMTQLRLTDPLVINLDGDAADISDQTFFFDIDGDGQKDQVNRLGPGSGFLALDRNEDGVINDGTELFGTASGDGFRDLAKYDDDGDGWIDEDDAIWSKLKIWTKDADGNDVLYRLADKGVGAICLTNVGTEFTSQSSDGSAKGVVRNTGVFLYENGQAGTVQHVDLVNHSYSA